jgi:hypothetical protein
MPGFMATAARPALVLTVDDAEPLRRAAHAIVEATDGFAAAAEVAPGEEAVACVERLRRDDAGERPGYVGGSVAKLAPPTEPLVRSERAYGIRGGLAAP